MTESKRVYQVTVTGATPEESGQVLAALKDLEQEAAKSISGTVSVKTRDEHGDLTFQTAGDTDA